EKLVLAGCLAQRHGTSLLDEIEEIDYLVGTGSIDQIVSVASGLLSESLERGARLGGLDAGELSLQPRALSVLAQTSYIKISERCNNSCTCCIIPPLRGTHRSRSIADLVADAQRLAGAGVRELVVIAPDTTPYGIDLSGRFSLARLIAALDEV